MLGEEIRQWIESGQDWDRGKALYLQHGHEWQFKIRLQKHQPNLMLRNLLYTKLRQIMSIDLVTLPETDKPVFKVKPKPVAAPAGGNIQNQIELLEVENARLYNQRAMLSNRLADTRGDETIRLENCRLIDEILRIHKKMLKNRDEIRRLNGGVAPDVLPEEKETNTGKIVVKMPTMSYTMDDLKAMDWAEISDLRERVRQQESKARTNIRREEDETWIAHYKEVHKVKKKELEIIDKVKNGKTRPPRPPRKNKKATDGD